MRVLPVCGSCPSLLRLVRLAPQDGTTSLIMASQYGHSEVVKRLIAAGAKVDAARKINPLDCLATACFVTEDAAKFCLHRPFHPSLHTPKAA